MLSNIWDTHHPMSFQGDSYIENVSLMAMYVHAKFEVPKLLNS